MTNIMEGNMNELTEKEKSTLKAILNKDFNGKPSLKGAKFIRKIFVDGTEEICFENKVFNREIHDERAVPYMAKVLNENPRNKFKVSPNIKTEKINVQCPCCTKAQSFGLPKSMYTEYRCAWCSKDSHPDCNRFPCDEFEQGGSHDDGYRL
jgi:hypothetical protein